MEEDPNFDVADFLKVPSFNDIFTSQCPTFDEDIYPNLAGSPQELPNSTEAHLFDKHNASSASFPDNSDLPSAQLPKTLVGYFGQLSMSDHISDLKESLQAPVESPCPSPSGIPSYFKPDLFTDDSTDPILSNTESVDEISKDLSSSYSLRRRASSATSRTPEPRRKVKKFTPHFDPTAAPSTSQIGKRTRKFTRATKGVPEIAFQNDVVIPVLPEVLNRLDSKDESEPIRTVDHVIKLLKSLFPQYAVRFNNDFVLHARTGESYGVETGRLNIDRKTLRRLPSEPKIFNKLTPEQKKDINAGLYAGMKDHEIAAMFGCHRSSIQRAKHGKREKRPNNRRVKSSRGAK
eukprot:TRINITY_DN9349_c0_g1_i1.p1 TRINITY_DN9349_c0_g1~~TRINITY_DN9349_c0_g1_i1.p1  ORF type:complete len:368 (-),score=58.15 TRINITY_DN9349_c0_g1_i1:34-1077(-)